MALHNELGKLGERVASRHLMLNGYSIIARDWRIGHRDLDIVAFKDGLTVFVEVKTRATDLFGTPEDAIDNEKISSILIAANAYIRRMNVVGPVRFDVISIVGEAEPFKICHFKGAFNANSVR